MSILKEIAAHLAYNLIFLKIQSVVHASLHAQVLIG
jgi:hypothetical protein